ncbi:hypothetical protein SAMN05192553_102405 [Cyclobacterium xiamenense]|uniref:Uncharacterized protein n=1 Tax=Cyclobacterium xiamenense TaxID=1297121 RepID=A0A1H6W972_9BACT|nr:hypothetical protein SAMN05192553_102405 [Cyclobacterium xiamenense]
MEIKKPPVKAVFVRNSKLDNYTDLPPIRRNSTAITARTNKMWINPPTLYTKAPKIHPMTRMMAMIYNNEFIVVLVNIGYEFYSNSTNSCAKKNFTRYPVLVWRAEYP